MKTTVLTAGLLLWLAAPMAQAVTCQNGIPASNPDAIYIDHGDGTVTDTRTGLMWDQCPWGQSGADCSVDSATMHITGATPWRNRPPPTP